MRGRRSSAPLHDALAGIQLGSGKEPGAAVTHGQERFAIDCRLEMEAEQVGFPWRKKRSMWMS